jgi:hypothetical protein
MLPFRGFGYETGRRSEMFGVLLNPVFCSCWSEAFVCVCSRGVMLLMRIMAANYDAISLDLFYALYQFTL